MKSEIVISKEATPALFGAVLGMMLSNGMVNRFETPAGGPNVLRLSLTTVDEKAASLPADVLDTIQDGEESEVKAAVREHEAWHLDHVLALFFDGGDLTQEAVRPSVVDEIAAERRRQIEVEGWTPEHDDEHTHGEMAAAGSVYAANAAALVDLGPHHDTRLGAIGRPLPVPETWPWDARWWKPRNARRDLVRAAALIVAEIERLDRAAAPGGTP